MKIKYYIFTLCIALISVFIDISSKLLVIKYIKSNTIDIIPNFFSLVYSLNYGAIFGTMKGMLPLFLMVIVVFMIIIFYSKEKLIGNKVLCVSYGLIVGGAFGNIIDRLFIYPKGAVIDFLDFHLTTSTALLSYPTFNIADICILVGVILFLLKYKDKK